MCRGKVQGRAADQEKKGRKRIKLMSCMLEAEEEQKGTGVRIEAQRRKKKKNSWMRRYSEK